MEVQEEISAEVARVYPAHLPDRLVGMSPAAQDAMFDPARRERCWTRPTR
jgi:hypothetical protein